MSAVVVMGLVFGAVGGGGLGFAAGFMSAIAGAFSSRNVNLGAYTIGGAFLGATLGGVTGWAVDGGARDVFNALSNMGDKPTVQQLCENAADSNDRILLTQYADGKITCEVTKAPAP